MTATELAIILKVRDQATVALKKVQGQIGGIKDSLKSFGSGVGLSGSLASLGAAGIAGSLAKIGIGFDMTRETSEIAFETMIGSADKARTHLDKLEAFAAKSPFEFPDILKADQRLLAFGANADTTLATLQAISDATAAAGGGSEKYNRIALAFGQIRSKGKLSAEEMLQLAEAGLPAWGILAQEMGTSVPRAMKAAERGTIGADQALRMLESGIDRRYKGLSERMAGTTAGAISNIKDLGRFMLADTMKPVFLKLRDILKGVADTMSSVRAGMMLLPKPSRDVITTIGALTIAIAPLLLALGAVGTAVGGLQTLWTVILAPVLTAIGAGFVALAAAVGLPVWAVIAIMASLAAATAGLYLAWESNWLGIRDVTNTALGGIGNALSSAWSWWSNGLMAYLNQQIAVYASSWQSIVAWFNWFAGEAGRIISENWTNIAGWFSWLTGESGRIIAEGWTNVAAWFGWLGSEAGRIIAENWTNIGAWFDWLARDPVGAIAAGWQTVVGWFNWMADSASRIVAGMGDTVGGWFGWIGDYVGSVWERIRGYIDQIGSAIDSIGGTARELVAPLARALNIPGFANGVTNFGGGLAVVGERGPELVNLPRGSDVIPSVATSGGGGGAMVFQFNAPIYGIDDLEGEIVAIIERAKRRGRV
jgi:tape measure domain-containing protein